VGFYVNISSRLSTEAQRHRVLADEVRRDSPRVDGTESRHAGKLESLAGAIDLYQPISTIHSVSEKRRLDPVCGIEMDAVVTARPTLEGEQHSFCSDACIQTFVGAAEQY
jgi:YHS domain-containing protein